MNENLKMGGLNPEELKETLQGVAAEYCEGVWALEYIAQLEVLLKDREDDLKLEYDKRIKLEAALELIADVAYDRDGYISAEKLGELIDEIYKYARNPAEAAKALRR